MNFESRFENISRYLLQNPGITLFITAAYFFTVVLPHQWFGKLIADLFENLSRSFYQGVMLGLAVIFMIVYLYLLLRMLLKQKCVFVWMTLLSLMVFTFLAYPLIIIHYVEAIHYLQYAILAFLLFPLFKNYYKVVFWGIILAFIDESYQHFYLDPGSKYLDFNDVVLDQIGLIWGLLPYTLQGSKELIERRVGFRRYYSEIIALAGLTVMILALIASDHLSIYPDQNAAYVMIKDIPLGFWKEVGHLNARYHVMPPLEGLIVIAFIYLYFCIGLTKIHQSKKHQTD